MKKYIIPICASFLIIGVAQAFKPATLFIETWEGIKRQAVYTQEQADKLFKDGYKLETESQLLGTSITTINGSDTLKNSRTTINDNFTALNSGKIETSTTTLPNITTLSNLVTVGTITSGTWSGTAINVNKGGTGSTTLSQHQVLIGSSTNAVGVVSGLGTDGQFLTSQGAGLPPVWESASVNQASDYTWTGLHDFQATTTGIKVIEAYTASTTITKMNAVYMATSTGNILQANASYSASSTYYQFLGFALNNAVDGDTVYIQTAGLVPGFTGLTKGLEYYVGNTAGTISSTVGNVPIKVGNAVSSTQLLLNREKIFGSLEQKGSAYVAATSTMRAYTDGNIYWNMQSNAAAMNCTLTINAITILSGGAAANDWASGSMWIKKNDSFSLLCSVKTAYEEYYWRPFN